MKDFWIFIDNVRLKATYLSLKPHPRTAYAASPSPLERGVNSIANHCRTRVSAPRPPAPIPLAFIVDNLPVLITSPIILLIPNVGRTWHGGHRPTNAGTNLSRTRVIIVGRGSPRPVLQHPIQPALIVDNLPKILSISNLCEQNKNSMAQYLAQVLQ